MPMINEIQAINNDTISMPDQDIPSFVKKSMSRMIKEINSNCHDKYNYKEMISKFEHLTREQK